MGDAYPKLKLAAVQTAPVYFNREADIERIIEAKRLHDVLGHYKGFDIFKLAFNQEELRPAHFTGQKAPENRVTEDSNGRERG